MLTNSRLVHQPHDHGRCINAALSRANNLCLEKGVRLTPTRESVLRLLWQSHQPLGAYQVQDQLSKLTGKSIAPPTVYRAIEFLSDLGLVHRLASLNAYIGCPFPNSEHSNLFMICNGCGSAAEVAHGALNDVLQNASEKAEFKLESQNIELFGLCPQCSQDTNQDTAHLIYD
ncbi:MAG: transcriptional repressor [Porticoccaceae bacterium]|jgi:Fur family zinc uptake transcriptional regulator|nr:transcriptional repressor [Porticoccaceae bacterium]MBT3799387.1 transcriptional repressor [Porticoccaceae bacterium]MBT4163490.1 transcriptional repressor [Porticoccaceae bacterium]MBT5003479.1 transcriptional repressor [Porticoccaceae bacterium]MBT5103302.1 transcriptional repressor [Porticoccaceae bacterium]